MDTHDAKPFGRTSFKRLVPENCPLSATKAAQVSRITSNRTDSAKACYRRLQPWLDFAYLPADSPEAFRSAYVERFRRKWTEPRELTSAALDRRLCGAARLGELMRAAKLFRELLEKLPALRIPVTFEDHMMEAAADEFTFPGEFIATDDGGGRLAFHLNPLDEGFKDAVGGTDLERWQRCFICRRVFFALRFKRGSKGNTQACSLRCNRVRRMRAWRAKQGQYEAARARREYEVARIQREEGKAK
jgi:hypothetical protein